jgi:hypothetical protein
MQKNILKHNYKMLAHLLKGLVAERFKRMAKDQVLFKFISRRLEPAVLIDLHLQTEREAMDLAEMSLLELVDSDRLAAELSKSAERIQKNFQRIFGTKEDSSYTAEALVEKRSRGLSSRVDLYRRILSLEEKVESPMDLARKSFRNPKKFEIYLTLISKAEHDFSEAILSHTAPLHRFLMKKHFDYELANFEKLWMEYVKEAFKKTPELTD